MHRAQQQKSRRRQIYQTFFVVVVDTTGTTLATTCQTFSSFPTTRDLHISGSGDVEIREGYTKRRTKNNKDKKAK
jgi:hypothetical protein